MRIIKYKWLNHDKILQPFLINENLEKIKLLNEIINFSIGDKHCTGYFSSGRYVKCPYDRLIESGWNCNECRLNDDFFMCMKCTGEQCINKKQRQPCEESTYYIYFAAFDGLIKVGISHESRLLERLIEQGADFGAKVARVKDGKDVRSMEQSIRQHLNIVDFVRGEFKQRVIFCNPNKCVANIYSAISALRVNGFADYLVMPEIYDLRDYYQLQNIYYNPEPLKITNSMKISGEVIAAKGNVIIIKDKQRLYSINVHDLIGRNIESNQ